MLTFYLFVSCLVILLGYEGQDWNDIKKILSKYVFHSSEYIFPYTKQKISVFAICLNRASELTVKRMLFPPLHYPLINRALMYISGQANVFENVHNFFLKVRIKLYLLFFFKFTCIIFYWSHIETLPNFLYLTTSSFAMRTWRPQPLAGELSGLLR